MSDIDFDELDKAVNSLISKASKRTTDNQGPTTNPESFPEPPPSQGQAQSEDTVVAADSDSPAVIPVNTTPQHNLLPKRRIGRFMDVVHPSSDMMAEETIPEVKTSMSDKVIMPINDPSSTKTEGLSSEPESEPQGQSDISQYATPPSTDMPDPLDYQNGFQDGSNTLEKQDIAADNENNHQANTDTTDSETYEPSRKQLEADDDADKPATAGSPFLEHTKVEKRPLGGISHEAPIEPTDDITSTPLPAELGKELVAIESGIVELPKEESDEAAKIPTEKDKHEKPSPFKAVPVLAFEEPPSQTSFKQQLPSVSHDETQFLLTPSAHGSIPQQYKKSSLDTVAISAQPLYNAEHYSSAGKTTHQSAVSHLFQWIFIVIGLLLLGAVLGAGIFVLLNNP